MTPYSIRVGILTVSDRGYRGEYRDLSGPLIRQLVVEQLGATVEQEAIVPDEREAIAATLSAWADKEGLDLALTTGGTGFAPRDVTPEATRRPCAPPACRSRPMPCSRGPSPASAAPC
jgi:molybdopterin adenylyltransferase